MAYMTAQQIDLIRSSWKSAGEEPLALGISFYDRLFSVCPRTRAVFRSPASLQTARLMKTVGYLINKLDRLDDSLPGITLIAEEYALLGIRALDYPAIATSLLWAMEKKLGACWNEELSEAWVSFYASLSCLVRENACTSPEASSASRYAAVAYA